MNEKSCRGSCNDLRECRWFSLIIFNRLAVQAPLVMSDQVLWSIFNRRLNPCRYSTWFHVTKLSGKRQDISREQRHHQTTQTTFQNDFRSNANTNSFCWHIANYSKLHRYSNYVKKEFRFNLQRRRWRLIKANTKYLEKVNGNVSIFRFIYSRWVCLKQIWAESTANAKADVCICGKWFYHVKNRLWENLFPLISLFQIYRWFYIFFLTTFHHNWRIQWWPPLDAFSHNYIERARFTGTLVVK